MAKDDKKPDPNEMPPDAMPDMADKENQDLLEQVKGRYEAMYEADNENRLAAMDDMKFVNVPGEQWDANMKQERGDRPCYEFNKIRVSSKRIINDMRANRPSAKVRAVEDGDKDGAELREGIIRNIANRSEFETVTDYAAEYQVNAGMAGWRIDTEYADDDVFEQDIWIRGIENPFSLYADPAARDFMKRDAKDWCITERMSVGEFERRFPDAEASDFSGSDQFDDEEWEDEETIRVVEYWYKKPIKKTLIQLMDGKVIDPDTDEGAAIMSMPEQVQIKNTREVYTHKICYVLANGQRLLTEPQEWAGRKFPFVMTYGEHMIIDGKTYWWGLPRFAKDAQRSYNVARTAIAETVAQAPKAKWWATPHQAEGLENLWAEAHKKNFPWLPFNPDPEFPGVPQMMYGPQVPQGLVQEAMMASDEIKAVTGIFDASMGAQGNETSGRAIYARQQQGEISTFNYQDNMAKAVQYTYEILLDLIPEIYDTERELRILGQDGAEDYKRINQVVMNYETGKEATINDMAVGKYDVTVTVGPNFSTQRQEAAETYTQLLQQMPDIMGVAGDLIFKSMDLPYADEVAERMKFMLPPQIQQSLNQDAEIPPEVMQMMAQAEQAMAQVQERAQEVQEMEQDAVKNKTRADTAVADIKNQMSDLEVAKARFDADAEKRIADIIKREAQLIAKQAQAEDSLKGLIEQAESLGNAEQQEALQKADILDDVLAKFMQAADKALMQINQRAEEINKSANRQIVGGTTRRENGELYADIAYDDGTKRTVRAKRENGQLMIVPPEADGEPESSASDQ